MTDMQTPESEDWVSVYTLTGDTYAEMVKEALENAEIPCTLQRSDLSTTFGTHSQTLLNEVMVLVPADLAEAALGCIEGIVGEVEG